MPINRRTLLKALAAAPAASLLQHPLARALAFDEGTPYSAYILLHGMFFLEFVGAQLYVASPIYDPHKFYVRRHGKGFQPLSGTINNQGARWEKGATWQAFPPTSLSFQGSC
jgi:hypothetical protein